MGQVDSQPLQTLAAWASMFGVCDAVGHLYNLMASHQAWALSRQRSQQWHPLVLSSFAESQPLGAAWWCNVRSNMIHERVLRDKSSTTLFREWVLLKLVAVNCWSRISAEYLNSNLTSSTGTFCYISKDGPWTKKKIKGCSWDEHSHLDEESTWLQAPKSDLDKAWDTTSAQRRWGHRRQRLGDLCEVLCPLLQWGSLFKVSGA